MGDDLAGVLAELLDARAAIHRRHAGPENLISISAPQSVCHKQRPPSALLAVSASLASPGEGVHASIRWRAPITLAVQREASLTNGQRQFMHSVERSSSQRIGGGEYARATADQAGLVTASRAFSCPHGPSFL